VVAGTDPGSPPSSVPAGTLIVASEAEMGPAAGSNPAPAVRTDVCAVESPEARSERCTSLPVPTSPKRACRKPSAWTPRVGARWLPSPRDPSCRSRRAPTATSAAQRENHGSAGRTVARFFWVPGMARKNSGLAAGGAQSGSRFFCQPPLAGLPAWWERRFPLPEIHVVALGLRIRRLGFGLGGQYVAR